MLDINFVRQNPEVIKKSLIDRQKNPNVLDQVLKADQDYRSLLSQVEKLRSDQNAITRSVDKTPTDDQRKSAIAIKQQLKEIENKLEESEVIRDNLLEQIPNIPAPDVPVGKDDAENVVIKTVGSIPKFDFTPLDHVDLGKKLDIIDVDKAGQLSGSRFGYFKGKGAVLEMSLMFYAFQKLISKGWTGMIPPAMIKSKTEWGCGYASNQNLFNAYYSVPGDDLIFISSSEHAVVPYHRHEILDPAKLPIKYVNFSPCFRREAGSYGQDTRGLFRVHFFNKVEINVFTLPDDKISDAMCQEMLAIEEEIMQELGLSYQIAACCTGDLPQPNRRMFDLNTWFPGQATYRETHSCSNCTDYQARRLNTKVKINGQNQFVHILNATVITDRAVLAIIENFQQKDNSVLIPKVLVPYTGFDRISQ